MPTRPVIDHGRCEAKRDCVRVCPYDVFEVRRMDPEDFTALGMLGKLRSTAHRRMTAYTVRRTSATSAAYVSRPAPKRPSPWCLTSRPQMTDVCA
jgi:NAD-dependent dihydropyrimidine dehydrogenase PreA subunit